MPAIRTLPGAGILRRPSLNWVDFLVGGAVLVLLFVLVRIGPGLNAPFNIANAPAQISTDPAKLPYSAARSLLPMFIAMAAGVVFTFVYATPADRMRRAQKVLLPLLDILQSIPIPGFLSMTVKGFIALFPHSVLGLECAAIFAIFTSRRGT